MIRFATLLFLILVDTSLGQSPRKQVDIDISHISLDLRFDWGKKQAFGTAEIAFKTSSPTDQLLLDSGKLSIESVEDGRGRKLKFKLTAPDGENNLRIKLAENTSDTESTVCIRYRTNHINRADPNNIWGSFGKGLRFQKPTSTTPNKRQQIWSSGEPDGNRYWFPCNNSLTDLRTTEIRATRSHWFQTRLRTWTNSSMAT